MKKIFRFKISDWYDIHSGFTFSLTHPYTALIGPNGAGKTTLLNQIEEIAHRRKITVLRYSDMADGRNNALDSLLYQGKMKTLALLTMSSEGERMRMNFFKKMDSFKKKLSKDSPTLLLIDSLDSGSSIDAQRFIREELEKLTEEYAVYVIVAANSYEFVKRADCVDVRSGKHHVFSSYEKYAQFICEYFSVHPFRMTEEKAEAAEGDVCTDKAETIVKEKDNTPISSVGQNGFGNLQKLDFSNASFQIQYDPPDEWINI